MVVSFFEGQNIVGEIYEYVRNRGRVSVDDVIEYFFERCRRYGNLVIDVEEDIRPAIRRKIKYLVSEGYLVLDDGILSVGDREYFPVVKRMKLCKLFDKSGRIDALFRYQEVRFVCGDILAVLSDRDIMAMMDEGKLVIEPFERKNLGPCSYDVTLGNEFGIYKEFVYDTRKQLKEERIIFDDGDRIVVCPPWFELNAKLEDEILDRYDAVYVFDGAVLGVTCEYLKLPKNVCAQYQGRSSLGRLFLTSHQTAGFIDAGFEGRVVLEIVALDRPVVLEVGQRIGQLFFLELKNECLVGYGERKSSKYQGQCGVVGFVPDRE
jgi:dCTP deaminase (dUMP-forming)